MASTNGNGADKDAEQEGADEGQDRLTLETIVRETNFVLVPLMCCFLYPRGMNDYGC